jgi:hypothetical protein
MAGSGCWRRRIVGFAMGNLGQEDRHSSAVSAARAQAQYFPKLTPLRMFVRGLQGSYNQYTPRLGIHVPHGDVILFGLCCGQIMFSWLFNPETMPVEYNRWYVAPRGHLRSTRLTLSLGLLEQPAFPKRRCWPTEVSSGTMFSR